MQDVRSRSSFHFFRYSKIPFINPVIPGSNEPEYRNIKDPSGGLLRSNPLPDILEPTRRRGNFKPSSVSGVGIPPQG